MYYYILYISPKYPSTTAIYLDTYIWPIVIITVSSSTMTHCYYVSLTAPRIARRSGMSSTTCWVPSRPSCPASSPISSPTAASWRAAPTPTPTQSPAICRARWARLRPASTSPLARAAAAASRRARSRWSTRAARRRGWRRVAEWTWTSMPRASSRGQRR